MGVFGFGPHSQHEFFLLIAALVLGCDWEHDVSCVEPCVTANDETAGLDSTLLLGP